MFLRLRTRLSSCTQSVSYYFFTFSQTVLHRAASGGHLKCVELLIVHGADTSDCGHTRITPADYARKEQHLDVARLLDNAAGEFLITLVCKNCVSSYIIHLYITCWR